MSRQLFLGFLAALAGGSSAGPLAMDAEAAHGGEEGILSDIGVWFYRYY